ncbi:MAG TPA: outer membrane beta-barrel protein [Aestuariivirga sp.]|nr:outer membrane beta-barrel protein [Aestuariivirga sp.]
MDKAVVSIVAGLAAATVLAPAAQADSSWDGFYAGVHGEYLWGEPVVAGVLKPDSEDFDGFAGGLTGGYNHVFDQFLFGIEADIALSEADGTASYFTSEGVNADLDWLSTIRGRVGFIHEDLLFFATGGLALGGLEADVFGSSPSNFDKTAVGYAVGGGAEWAISDRMTVKAEYLYIDLAAEDLSATFIFDRVGLETNLVRFGVNWRF